MGPLAEVSEVLESQGITSPYLLRQVTRILAAGDAQRKKSTRFSGRSEDEALRSSVEAWAQVRLFSDAWAEYAAKAEASFDQVEVLQNYVAMAMFDPTKKCRLPATCETLDKFCLEGYFPHSSATV